MHYMINRKFFIAFKMNYAKGILAVKIQESIKLGT